MDNELENGKAKASPALADRLAKYFDKAVIDQNTEVQTRPNLHAVAVNATEMKESNAQIGEYLRAKLEALEAEHAEIQSAVDIATENKWASDALVNVGKRRITGSCCWPSTRALRSCPTCPAINSPSGRRGRGRCARRESRATSTK